MNLTFARGSAGPLLSSVAERRAVFAATALAIAQPIFDLLGRNPEFLQVREMHGLRLLVFGLGLFLGIPGLMMLIAELAGRGHRPLRRLLYHLWLWFGLWLLVLVLLRRAAPDLGSAVVFATATIAAAASVWMYARSRWLQELGKILSLLVWAIPLLFFLRSGVRISPPQMANAKNMATTTDQQTAASQQPPILLVVWDELPVTSLLTASGEIDPDWFPGFSRLASTSTWFRDALTTSTNTLQALPDLLSGRVVDPVDHRAGLNDPYTVFNLMEASHQLFAYSAVAGVVPADVALLGDGARPRRWEGLLSDLRILYLHLTMPRRIREDLPPVGAAWGGFGNRETEGSMLREAIDSVQAAASQEKPPFTYLHTLLPHHPWTYLPTGARYWGNDHMVAQGMSGVMNTGHWTTEVWLVIQAYQRHLLQSMYADRLLAELIDRLVELDIWHSALVVVTADHGASFTPGQALRTPTESAMAEVAAIPLFVKLPGQTESRVDHRRASILDILPTIADACGLDVPWPVDGASLLREDQLPERERWVSSSRLPPQKVTRDLREEILAIAKARRLLFGRSGTGVQDPFRIGPFPHLVGQPLSDFEIVARGEPWSAERVEPDLNDQLIRARLKLLISGLDKFERPIAFAVVVDDEIVATTAIFPAAGPTLSVLVPEKVALRVPESLRLFRIVGSGRDQPRFEEIRLLSSTYRFSRDGVWIVDGAGDRWKIDPSAFRGEIHPLQIPGPWKPSRVLAWGVDDQDRVPERVVAFHGDQSVTWARPGLPEGDFLDHLGFAVPREQVFFLVFPRFDGQMRYFALGADGRAGELSVVP